MSVMEIARLRSQRGMGDRFEEGFRAGAQVIRQAPGCRSVIVYRCVEEPDTFVLAAEWDDIEAHKAFRSSSDFPRYRTYIQEMLDGAPEVAHYRSVAQV